MYLGPSRPLLTEEASEPYEKPPLSKAVLLGKANPGDTPIAGKGGVAAFGVELRRDGELWIASNPIRIGR